MGGFAQTDNYQWVTKIINVSNNDAGMTETTPVKESSTNIAVVEPS